MAKNMKNKGSDKDCFSDCRIWDQRNVLKMELTEEDSLEGSAHTPMYNHLILPLSLGNLNSLCSAYSNLKIILKLLLHLIFSFLRGGGGFKSVKFM